jgi:hypothetical protein
MAQNDDRPIKVWCNEAMREELEVLVRRRLRDIEERVGARVDSKLDRDELATLKALSQELYEAGT